MIASQNARTVPLINRRSVSEAAFGLPYFAGQWLSFYLLKNSNRRLSVKA